MTPSTPYLLGLALAAGVVAAPAAAQSAVTPAGPRDAAATVEANRPRIVERMVEAYGATMVANGVPLDAFRAALWELTPDRLLAASLAQSAEEVNTIIARALAAPAQRIEPKDGSGSGPNSWIGYTAGGNVASGSGSAVAAGRSNAATGTDSFVGAGTFNAANGQGSFVGGGTSNVANAVSALVMGGFDNRATVIDSLVVAGAGNRATGARSVVVGGGYNLASGQWSFIGGGGRQTGAGAAGANAQDNVAAGELAVVTGGQGNHASGFAAVIGGGQINVASGSFSTVAGGGANGTCSIGTITRSCANTATSTDATVGGGVGNQAGGFASTIGGGFNNTATGSDSTVGGGGGNTASGGNSTIPGGVLNIASGNTSFATGRNANADQNQCALFGLWSTQTMFNCLGVANIFRIGSDHGFSVEYLSQRGDGGGNRWVAITDLFSGQTIATWTGAFLSDAGVWVNASSSRERKTDFETVDPQDVLQRVARMPVSTWRYKAGEEGVRHMGPMAEDFWNAFGIGYGAHTIADLDARGVAFAAIQGLKQQLDARDAALERLQRRLDALERELDDVRGQAGRTDPRMR